MWPHAEIVKLHPRRTLFPVKYCIEKGTLPDFLFHRAINMLMTSRPGYQLKKGTIYLYLILSTNGPTFQSEKYCMNAATMLLTRWCEAWVKLILEFLTMVTGRLIC